MTSFTLKEASLPEPAGRIRFLSIVLIVLFGVEGIFAVMATDPAAPPTASSIIVARLTTLGLYLLVALLFVMPLWRYVQWTSALSRQAPVAEFDRDCIRLEKWIRALQILNILGLAFFCIGLIVVLFSFRFDSKYVIDLSLGVARIVYTLLAARIFASALIYMSAVRNNTATLSASTFQRQLVQAILLTGVMWAISAVQMALTKMDWPAVIISFASMLVTLALMWVSHQFIGQTAVNNSIQIEGKSIRV